MRRTGRSQLQPCRHCVPQAACLSPPAPHGALPAQATSSETARTRCRRQSERSRRAGRRVVLRRTLRVRFGLLLPAATTTPSRTMTQLRRGRSASACSALALARRSSNAPDRHLPAVQGALGLRRSSVRQRQALQNCAPTRLCKRQPHELSVGGRPLRLTSRARVGRLLRSHPQTRGGCCHSAAHAARRAGCLLAVSNDVRPRPASSVPRGLKLHASSLRILRHLALQAPTCPTLPAEHALRPGWRRRASARR